MGTAQTPELIIFDCDGVLIDSEPIASAAEADALTSAGYRITAEEVARRFSGVPSEAVYAEIEREMGRALPDTIEADVEYSVLEKYRIDLQPIRGAKDVLEALPIRCCVASSSTPNRLALGLIETGLYELVYPHVFSTSLVARGKPSPDIFEYAAGAMAVAPTRCLVVEDSVAGVTAACAANMTCVGFIGGSHSTDDHERLLLDAGAENVLSELSNLLHLITE
jgi:HAD superfamily hydrolase (TIGR01509 family)